MLNKNRDYLDKAPLDFVGGLFYEGAEEQATGLPHNIQTLVAKIQNPDINSWKLKSTHGHIGFLQQPLYVFIQTLNLKDDDLRQEVDEHTLGVLSKTACLSVLSIARIMW